MGKTVTVNLDESLQKRVKEKAKLKFGNRKGSLGKAFNEALEEWLNNDDQDILRENMRFLNEGIKMKKWKFSREDLYER